MEIQLTKWTSSLGLLPVNMMHNSDVNDRRFALLDGDMNNFCLDLGSHIDDKLKRSLAWSANMRNYVQIKDGRVYLYTLDKLAPEIIDETYVNENINKFYDYLGLLSADSTSIVQFLMKSFRALRNAIRDEQLAEKSLSSFLYILSSLRDENVDINNWGLPKDVKEYQDLFDPNLLEQIREDINAGISNKNLIPNVDMILRHTSGSLFEEANFYVHYGSQLELFPSYHTEFVYNPNAVGAYFTPPFLARTIVEECLKQSDLKEELVVFEPACGSGQFLLEVLRQLKFSRYSGKITIYGWDISPIAKILSDYQLCFEKREWGDRLNFKIEVKDSLTNQWPLNVDMMLMNPPYKSWELMDIQQRENAERALGLGKLGKVNLANVFYMLAIQSIKKTGVIGCVMPASFLSSDSAKKLRRIAFELVKPKLIGKLGNFIFRSAYVDVCMIIASNKDKELDQTQMLWIDNRDNYTHQALRELRIINNEGNKLCKKTAYSIYGQKTSFMEKTDLWSPISADSNNLHKMLNLKLLMNVMRKVGDVFNVKTGARTGNQKAFVLSADEYDELPMQEKKYFRPSVDSKSFVHGNLIKNNYVFFPYPTEKYALYDEQNLQKKMPYYYNHYLLPHKNELLGRYQINENKWWLLSRPGPWQFEKEMKLVSKEFGRSGDFSIDLTGEFVVQGGCMWEPKDKLKENKRLLAYVPYLNSNLFDDILKIYCKQLSGGYWYVLEKKYIDRIPIPNFDKMEICDVELLENIGRKMVNGEEYDQSVAEEIIKHIING